MEKTIGPIKITIDLKDHIALSREVLEELQRRVNELSPRISEGDALRILLLDMTFDYLKAKGWAGDKTLALINEHTACSKGLR